ncbi:MAG: hypothetical protein J6U37_03270 [Lachnospiraceae bacterium]|nr:hypothetical protein [Lachnospiraceae bacterium]
MPKVTLNPMQRKAWEIERYILGEMKLRHITQKDLADAWGISQPAARYLIHNAMSISYSQLLTIFNVLETSDEDRRRLTTL